MMLLLHNPTPERLSQLIRDSQHRAAKWIKDEDTGELWYWPAEAAQHARMAALLSVTRYSKGMAVMD
jgi:hypothetical protein